MKIIAGWSSSPLHTVIVCFCVFHGFLQVWQHLVPAMVCCHSRPRLCSRSSAYTLALGLGFITLGTSRILLLKFSANAGEWLKMTRILFLSSNRGIICDRLFFKSAARLWKTCHKIGCNIYLCIPRTCGHLVFVSGLSAENKYDFLPASVNLLAEALKFLFCLVMSIRVIVRGWWGWRHTTVSLGVLVCVMGRSANRLFFVSFFRGTTMHRAFLFLQHFLPQFPEVGCTCFPLLSRQPHHLLCDDLPAAC